MEPQTLYELGIGIQALQGVVRQLVDGAGQYYLLVNNSSRGHDCVYARRCLNNLDTDRVRQLLTLCIRICTRLLEELDDCAKDCE